LFVEFDPCKSFRINAYSVPGFAPKRIYLENVADRAKAGATANTDAPSQSKKGFLGVNWGFDGSAKK
jgi:hypothetical protein